MILLPLCLLGICSSGCGGRRLGCFDTFDYKAQHYKIEYQNENIERQQPEYGHGSLLPDKVDEQPSMEIASRCFSGFWTCKEIMRYHTKNITGKNSTDEGLIPCRVERGCFWCKKY
jgi:hypothetical protein